MRSVAQVIAEEIEATGPIGFDRFMDLTLYHPTAGFYSTGGRTGRRGDFLTSPEVGPLFGSVVAGAIDSWWDELGQPEPWVVVDAGAGPGTLARSIIAAEPACGRALRYLLVESSAPQRLMHGEHLDLTPPSHAFMGGAELEDEPLELPPGPQVISLAEMPRLTVAGVVIANELLDNLPVRLLERAADGWEVVLVGLGSGGSGFEEVLVPAPAELSELADRLAPDASPRARLPVQEQAVAWLREALASIDRGRVVVIDYCDTSASLAARQPREWLRTYRAHGPGEAVLDAVGHQDITCDVAIDQLARVGAPTEQSDQAGFLRGHGIEDLVDAGRRTWKERAGIGDLEAVRARSRVGEAEALLDPRGLGGFSVLEWVL